MKFSSQVRRVFLFRHISNLADLLYEPLNLDSGPIWAALHLDYPHHSFDRIGLYFGKPSALSSCL
jgi:hypothetical protein